MPSSLLTNRVGKVEDAILVSWLSSA